MTDNLKSILKNNPSLAGAGLDEDTLAVANGNLNNLTKRISIQGKVFRKIVGGKEVSTVENSYMNVVIVKMAHTASRSYYADSYEEGKKVSPACWSNDSKTPDEEVKTPQAESCHTCPFSVRGSGSRGRGMACRLSWRLAVVLPNDPQGDVMQLVLPATSCFGKENEGKWPFRPYIQMLANNSVSAGRVVTRMQFNSDAVIPKVLFSPVEAIDEKTLTILQEQAQSVAANQAIKLTVYQPENNVKREPVKFDVFDDTKEKKEITIKEKEPLIIIKKYKKGERNA
tara:strand:+ start:4579 stop:5430 length:852 start_codon:yes stop_codon:yes gene_type:complete